MLHSDLDDVWGMVRVKMMVKVRGRGRVVMLLSVLDNLNHFQN